ncbi:phosphatase PAP2 family protein [Geobacter pelophilus]|uniref:Phosphatase PAP2 family protein n=1 Tax=Geoanaerobacter pelophilus TaxID=60036 RepID=A0AAW4L4A9_9BACT|nr:phosphatase PAP2 family protein [Geoanaerobacter pelophilus]MBT0664370.1 phosphatase PAP2 family protein [Geoanaerobacter pelophilus]
MTVNSQPNASDRTLSLLNSRWFSLSLCIGWLVTIIYLSLTPSPPTISNSVLGWDKLHHASAYALLTFLLLRAFPGPKPGILPVFIGVVCFGAGMEVAQGVLTANRSADIMDSLANLVGALIVSLGYFWARQCKASGRSGSALLYLAIILPICGVSVDSRAAELAFQPVDEVTSASLRLVDEAKELVRSPLSMENKGLLATMFVAGAVAVTTQYDEDIRDKVATRKGRNLDRATDAGSLLGDPFIHLGFAAAVYGGGLLGDSPKYKELGEMFGEAAILADASTLLLKQAIGRGRPGVSRDSGSYRLFQFGTDYDSLPSMHTASSFAMASVMASASKSPLTALASYAAATFVGFSRIYQDKHWASDVLLGAAIGELCGRVVTHYHATAQARRIAVAPMISDSSAMVALVGRF